jgi:hypothetical protein
MEVLTRHRSDSLRSRAASSPYPMPTVPQNTPDTSSVISNGASAHFAKPSTLQERLEKAYREEPGRFWEHDTTVPENTPATGTPSSHYYRAQSINLPRIDETLEQLPPPLSSQFSSPPPSIVDSQRKCGHARAQLDGPDSDSGESTLTIKPAVSHEGPPTQREFAAAAPCVATGAPFTPISTGGHRPGVREHTDWHHDVESEMARSLARLANLAEDDHQRDPTKTAEMHYRSRLNLLLNDCNLRFMYGEIGAPPIPTTAEPPSPLPPPATTAGRATSPMIKDLSKKVDKLIDTVKKHGNQIDEIAKKQKEGEEKRLLTPSTQTITGSENEKPETARIGA